MKIAYILPALRNVGPIIVAKSLVDYLTVVGCEVDVYYFDDFPMVDFKCPTFQIEMNSPVNFDKYDIVHSHCLRSDRYVVKWKKKNNKAKMVTTLHQDTFRSFRYQHNLILSHLITWYWCKVQTQFDGVISISNQLKQSYENRIKAPITTIYNGCSIQIDGCVDEYISESLLKVKGKYKLLGTYALVTRRKGLEQILKALVHLPDYAFVIIGEGPAINSLRKMSLKLDISNRVLFFPYQKNPCNYLTYFDIYTMPSYSEGFGLAMVEAALGKRAIVCSDILSFHEIFPNEEAVFFELDNICSLKNAIVSAYERKNQLGELAYQRALDCFTSQRMAEEHLIYYQSLIR